MKILIFTDNHFCERYSIVGRFGRNYTVRLENQLNTMTWIERLACEKGCECVICAGDFFDRPQLTGQELTALRDIPWAHQLQHYFLVGNHESGDADLRYNSAKALESDWREIVSEPTIMKCDAFELAFLPYIPESQRKPAKEYFGELGQTPRLLISHNDLAGVQMGPAISRTGFAPEELGEICTLCVNGHLHNGRRITDKVINLGNVTGKDFGEDASVYSHNVMIVDTSTMEFELVENPYALNFYKIELSCDDDLPRLRKLKDNAVVSVQCPAQMLHAVKEAIEGLRNISDSRVISKQTADTPVDIADIAELSVDHFVKFAECCRAKFEASDVLEEELSEILK